MKYFKQKEKYSCAAATFRNLLLLFGKKTTESRLRKILGTTTQGTDENGIKQACEFFNLDYEEIIIIKKLKNKIFKTVKEYLNEKYKIILCVDDFSHWVLICGIRSDEVIIIDPDKNEQTIKYYNQEELLKRWWSVDKENDIKQYYGIAVRKKY